jgi:hypothetical protein
LFLHKSSQYSTERSKTEAFVRAVTLRCTFAALELLWMECR